jgi:PadR family transcriptional regulator, regulatory protein PadR
MTGTGQVARTPSELLQGTVHILILRALAWEQMHGYAISHWLDQRSDGALGVDGAGLYQALHRLEQRKLITSVWGLSENNRRAKYYRLTPAGESALRAESDVWHHYAEAVAKVLSPA